MEISKVSEFNMGIYNVLFDNPEDSRKMEDFDSYLRGIGVPYSSWFFDGGNSVVLTTKRVLSGDEEIGLVGSGVDLLVPVFP